MNPVDPVVAVLFVATFGILPAGLFGLWLAWRERPDR
jgi:hypothetical protein